MPLSTAAELDLERARIGSPARHLAQALGAGLPVGKAWVIPVDAFRQTVSEQLPPGHDPSSLIKTIERHSGLERAARARERLLEATFDEQLSSYLEELHTTELQSGATVTASVACDAGTAGLADLYRTRTGVLGLSELLDAIREMWAIVTAESSLLTLKALRYRSADVAVLIQPGLDCAMSGKLLTAGPPGDDSTRFGVHHTRFAVHVPGVATPVFDGIAAPDSVTFTAEGNVIRRATFQRREQLVLRDGKLTELPLTADIGRALSQPVISQLAKIAQAADALPDAPWMLSFGIDQSEQVSVTDAVPSEGATEIPGGERNTVWSLAKLSEVLPGVPTPLTWSIGESLVNASFREAFARLGHKVSRSTQLVAKVRGRFYSNTSEVMAAAAHVPGIDLRSLLELVQAGSVERAAPHLRFERKGSILKLPKMASRLFGEHKRLTQRFEEFEQEAERERQWLSEMDLAILPDDALKTTLREVQGFFETTGTLLMDCAGALLGTYVALKTVIARKEPQQAEHLAQAVTAGAGELATATPGVALAEVMRLAGQDAEFVASMAKANHPSDLKGGEAKQSFMRFLALHGDRAMREMELLTPRWSEDPQPLYAMLRAGAATDVPDPEQTMSHARALADRRLAELEERMNYAERALVRSLVSRARALVRLRELTRVWLARTVAMTRQVVLDIDRRLRRLDGDFPQNGAFYCRQDELMYAMASFRADLGPLVRLRMAEHRRHLLLPDPPQTFIGAPGPLDALSSSATVLRGNPGAPGIVTGRARVIGPVTAGVEQLQAGDIVVTRTADLGLAPLMAFAAGIVTEVGGPISHAAVVAREFGIAAAVNVPGALATIRNGELIRVDAARGAVERLEA